MGLTLDCRKIVAHHARGTCFGVRTTHADDQISSVPRAPKVRKVRRLEIEGVKKPARCGHFFGDGKMDSKSWFTLPLVVRGVPLDGQTQVGWCGTQLQVLNQQGRISDTALEPCLPPSSWACRRGTCVRSCPVLHTSKKANPPPPCCRDEESDVGEPTGLREPWD